jgi:hypothetical protein
MLVSRPSKWCFTILLLLCGIASFGDDSVDSAVKRLSSVERFAFGAVGYGGVTSTGEIDFKLVLAQPPPVAVNAFERLYATGNPQGKSYALSGIRKLNPSKFKDLLESLRASTDQVEIERGCIISHELLPEVAKQIDRGKFRF